MPICRQVGHWAKDCTNCDKSPKTDFYKYHKLGYWKAILPGDPRASRSSAKPSLMMVQQDWSGLLDPAPLKQITTTGLEPRVQLDVAGRSENFLVDTGANYSVLISYSGAFSSQTCTILGAIGKATTKRFTWALLCCWDGQIFSHQFLVVPECPTPLLGRGLSWLWNPVAIAVLIDDSLKLSLGGKLFWLATKWSNSWMGEAIYGCLIRGSSDIK